MARPVSGTSLIMFTFAGCRHVGCVVYARSLLGRWTHVFRLSSGIYTSLPLVNTAVCYIDSSASVIVTYSYWIQTAAATYASANAKRRRSWSLYGCAQLQAPWCCRRCCMHAHYDINIAILASSKLHSLLSIVLIYIGLHLPYFHHKTKVNITK